jgi:hypothetical protein
MRFLSYCGLLAALGLVFGASASGLIAQNDALRQDLSTQFSRADVVRLSTGQRRLVLTIDGREAIVRLRANDIRSADFRAEATGENGSVGVDRGESQTFTGEIDGEPEAVVRLSTSHGRFTGLIKSRGEKYFLESALKFSRFARAGDHVIYREDALKHHNDLSCGVHLIDRVEQASGYAAENVPYGHETGARGALRQIDLATEADFEYVTTLGSVAAANGEILSVLNVVDGLYERELNLSIAVVYQHAWTTPDPFAGANVEAVLRNFQNYWNANFPQSSVPRDVAHMFSGKANVLGQGWAFVGVVCNNPAFAYGMSGYVNFPSGQHLVTAHELAHNLGANHVDAAQGCANTLMNASLTGATPLTFCQYSRNEIGNHVGANGACLASVGTGPFDFDGDARTDLAIFRPSQGQWWYSRSSDGASRVFTFGGANDRIAPADYTGDGRTDIAVWRPATGQWFILRSEDSSFYSFPFGANGDVPVPADFDGDRRADPAVYRPVGNFWYIARSSDGGTTITRFGVAGDLPVNADYDGDSRSDIAIFRPAFGQWWIERSTAGSIALQFGNSSDRTVQGDYTGDGKADIALFRPSNGSWFILRSENLSFYSFPFGTSTDIPSPGDYDGDAKYDAAVFRPASSTWFANLSTGGSLIRTFGASGDQPVPSAYVR